MMRVRHVMSTIPVSIVLALMMTGPTWAWEPGVYDCEAGGRGGSYDQWSGGPPATLSVDSLTVHRGRYSARIQRDETSEGTFSAASFRYVLDRSGETIELRGWLRSEDVGEWFGLWFRQDSNAGVAAFDNMQSRGLTGTTEWTEYRVTLPLKPETRTIICGALLSGPGTVWMDDLSLWIDGKPLKDAPTVLPETTILDLDKEFANSSGLDFSSVTEIQADNLALLGRVWGFLKYHHPVATSGNRHWDFELFRVIPDIVAAADTVEARSVLSDWIDELGPVPPCDPCAEAAREPAQAPDVDWIMDEQFLGTGLSHLLTAVYQARPADGRQFYVGTMPNVGNPTFEHEPAYDMLQFVDTGYRLLGLMRFWNIIEYWSPNRDVIGEPWPPVLREFVPLMVEAVDHDDYKREMLKLIARVGDTHTQLGNALELRPPGMLGQLPVFMRWVEDHPVVAGWAHEFSGPATGLEIGDAVLAVDGTPVSELFEEWRPYYSASNEPRRNMDLATAVARGPITSCRLKILRGGKEMEVMAERMAIGAVDLSAGRQHTLPGPGFRMLQSKVAYMPLDRLKADSVKTWVSEAIEQDADGLIIDCRAYPGDFPIFDLGGRLVENPTPFVTFTTADLTNPGTFLWQEGPRLMPGIPHFAGKVVVLVDETSISSSEYHAMAFRIAPRATVMGSTTAGADGNISRFPLPGIMRTQISGIGIYDELRYPTQRVGIMPDIVVLPTIEGIRTGKDEVLAAAVEHIIGRRPSDREMSSW